MALPPFRQRPACELSSGTEKMRFNAAFNLFHKLRQGEREREREREGLKGDDKSVGETVLEIMAANHFLSQQSG